MGNYNINLTPKFVNLTTEGGLDTSIINGKSTQRTYNLVEVLNAGNRKVINKVVDGGEFNDTTFQNSSGVGTFEITTFFSFDRNKLGNFLGLTNENRTVLALGELDYETTALTNYAIKSGQKVMFSMTIDVWAPDQDYTGVGVANNSFDVNKYLGQDLNSIGVWDDSSFYVDGEYTELNVNFQSNGSVVDVAVDRENNLIWFRANGGDWNGDNLQDPATATGGIDISFIAGDIYPGACPYYADGVAGQISINTNATPPEGFELLQ